MQWHRGAVVMTAVSERPVCKSCCRNKAATKGWRILSDGTKARKYKTVCNACYSRKRKGLNGPAQKRVLNPLSVYAERYKKYKGDSCEMCGFVAVHPCQLDVDHKDGNGGCLVKEPSHVTGTGGILCYLNVDGRIRDAVAQVTKLGGKVLEPTHPIGPHGFRALVLDSEGNRLALHSTRDA